MKKFNEYTTLPDLAEQEQRERSVVFCWGRFNPPTRGHAMVFKKAAGLAEEKGASFYIFTSQTNDQKKNPLTYEEKIKYLRLYFPQYANSVLQNSNVRTLFDAAQLLTDRGYTTGYLVVGEDRVVDFQYQMNKYTQFREIKVVSAGERDETATDIRGVSGGLLRQFVRDGKLDDFRRNSPKADTKLIDDVYHTIRRAYNIKIQHESTNVELKRSLEREKFYNGTLVSEGDMVLLNNKNVIAEVTSLGSNYVNVMALDEKVPMKIWLSDITKL